MISVNDYIKMILKKKGWSNKKLCEEMNKLESKLGDSRTTQQNISNYLCGQHDIRPKWIVKVEYVLDLPLYTLINMTKQPSTKESQKELKETIKKVREVNK